MALAAQSPEALTKRLFILTLLGIVVYITAVLVLMGTPEKLPTDARDYGVTQARAPQVAASQEVAQRHVE